MHTNFKVNTEGWPVDALIYIKEILNSAGLDCARLLGEYGAVPRVGDSVKMTYCWQAWRKCQACGHHTSHTMSHKGHSKQIKSTPEFVNVTWGKQVLLYLWGGKKPRDRFKQFKMLLFFLGFLSLANVLNKAAVQKLLRV